MSKPKLCVLGDGQLAEAIRFGFAQFPSSHESVNFEEADVLWMADDTPIIDGEAQFDFVIDRIESRLHYRSTSVIVIVSSQLPVGTIADLEREYPIHRFFCVPENIRVSHNIQDWLHQERVVIGSRRWTEDYEVVSRLCSLFTTRIVQMDTESAEMTKHALNAYLAVTVAFSNEMAEVCRSVGADPEMVARALQMDPRVGNQAYLNPSGPYATGHLEREVDNMIALGAGPLMMGCKMSNDQQLLKQRKETK